MTAQSEMLRIHNPERFDWDGTDIAFPSGGVVIVARKELGSVFSLIESWYVQRNAGATATNLLRNRGRAQHFVFIKTVTSEHQGREIAADFASVCSA